MKMQQREEATPLQEAITTLVSQEAEKHQFELIACGMPENLQSNQLAVHYLSCEKLKIEEVRKLFVNCVEAILNELRQDQMVSLLNGNTITLAHLNFNITFVNVEGAFREPPHIAYAFLKNEKICYCYYDNLFGKFIEYNDVEEEYEEAKKIVHKMKEISYEP